MLKTTWELWTYDVWGNEEDGYTVNDRQCIDREYHLRLAVKTYNVGTPRQFSSAHPSDKQIRDAFGIEVMIDTGGDDTQITIDSEEGFPLGEMHCTSHKSLSPICKVGERMTK